MLNKKSSAATFEAGLLFINSSWPDGLSTESHFEGLVMVGTAFAATGRQGGVVGVETTFERINGVGSPHGAGSDPKLPNYFAGINQQTVIFMYIFLLWQGYSLRWTCEPM